jgi:hypothetical protein
MLCCRIHPYASFLCDKSAKVVNSFIVLSSKWEYKEQQPKKAVAEVVGSTPTRSIYFTLVNYGIRISTFFDLGRSLSFDGTLLSLVSLLECTQNGDVG